MSSNKWVWIRDAQCICQFIDWVVTCTSNFGLLFCWSLQTYTLTEQTLAVTYGNMGKRPSVTRKVCFLHFYCKLIVFICIDCRAPQFLYDSTCVLIAKILITLIAVTANIITNNDWIVAKTSILSIPSLTVMIHCIRNSHLNSQWPF